MKVQSLKNAKKLVMIDTHFDKCVLMLLFFVWVEVLVFDR